MQGIFFDFIVLSTATSEEKLVFWMKWLFAFKALSSDETPRSKNGVISAVLPRPIYFIFTLWAGSINFFIS